ncbi:related to phosphoethanolamine N-methyltransferase [Lecanosticta acicola]|uniref:Related to phosphoethanolamine N-methyltransferase n=1 Tax=Lecanosticta acicola TaxID=111012 RepID=A0AAI8YV79_9PEZI|nr:related to phosphoethanolamine N-methyltransferase [Lecanosticta acicola]
MASAISDLSRTTTGNDRFNAEAAAWDWQPFVHQASKGAAEAIIRILEQKYTTPEITSLDVLELGCGTGVLSFLLAPKVRQIVAIDAAQGMIDVLRRKCEQPELPKNILPLALLLEDPEDTRLPPADCQHPGGERQRFDLVTSHLVLHHIPSLRPVLETLHGCLKKEGCVMLTDFEDFGPEAKRFHPASKMVGVARHGIDADEIAGLMREVGFVDVDVRAHWSEEKIVERYEGEFGPEGGSKAKDAGEKMRFPFLVCHGVRR